MRLDISGIVSCIPVEGIKEIPDFEYTPPPSYTKDTCELCFCEVWIGPKQKEKKDEDSKMAVMCTLCSLTALKMLNAGNTTDELMDSVQHLGGESGKYTIDGKDITTGER